MKTALDKHLPTAVQTGLNKPLQDAFRTSFAKQLVPAFENACQSMFIQINTAFTQGFEEHLEASRTALSEPVALTHKLKDSLNAAQSLVSSLHQEQQLMRTSSLSSMHSQSVKSPTAPVDIKTEFKRLLAQGHYEEVFGRALGMQDVGLVSWLCAQTSVPDLSSREPPVLSQMVLLSLVQQLAAGLTHGEAESKLTWIREAALALNPKDAMLAPHLKQVLQQVHTALQGVLPRLNGGEAMSCKLAMHVVHSQMTS